MADERDVLDRLHPAEPAPLVRGIMEGMSRHHNHGGMVLARSPRKEIRPRIVRWLNDRVAA